MMVADLKGQPGVAVDSRGGAVIDPTVNVKELIESANRRQDDLREAFNLRILNEIQCLKEMIGSHSNYQKELAEKESGRLDSIRQVDEVTKTAAQAQNNLAISTLAKQTSDLQITLSTQVAAAANAVEARRQADMSEIGKRVSALELASSASVGKQTVADPQVAELRAAVTSLLASQNTRTGFDAGKAAAVAAALAAATALGGGGVALITKLMSA